jgi:hypothetical protein
MDVVTWLDDVLTTTIAGFRVAWGETAIAPHRKPPRSYIKTNHQNKTYARQPTIAKYGDGDVYRYLPYSFLHRLIETCKAINMTRPYQHHARDQCNNRCQVSIIRFLGRKLRLGITRVRSYTNRPTSKYIRGLPSEYQVELIFRARDKSREIRLIKRTLGSHTHSILSQPPFLHNVESLV